MRWRRSNETLFRVVPDGVIVISLRGGDPVRLSAPGEVVWAALAVEPTLDELVEGLVPQFDAPAREVRADCIGLLAGLQERGLVEGLLP
jgi:hypothetical protein